MDTLPALGGLSAQGSEAALDWVISNLYRSGRYCKDKQTFCNIFVRVVPVSVFVRLAGDELHFFHVVPNPQAKLLGGGMGLADAGEFMVAPPDPKDDRKQVCLRLRAETAMTFRHYWACMLLVKSQPQVLCIRIVGNGDNIMQDNTMSYSALYLTGVRMQSYATGHNDVLTFAAAALHAGCRGYTHVVKAISFASTSRVADQQSRGFH